LEALARLKRGDAVGSGAVDDAARGLERADSRYHLAYVLNSAASIDLQTGHFDRARTRAEAALRSAEIVDRVAEVQRANLILAAGAEDGGRVEGARHRLETLKTADLLAPPGRLRAILPALQSFLPS